MRARSPCAVGVEHVGGGDAGGLVHPHVERGVVPVGEAALGLVELQRGDAEVEQDAERGALGVLGEHRGDVVVDGVDADEAVAEAGQPLPRQGQRLLVAVEADDPRLRAALEDRLGVAAHARGCRRRRPRRASAAPARGGRRCGRAAPGRAVRRRLLRLLIVVLRVGAGGGRRWRGVAGPAAGRPGGWSPSDPGPARGKSRRESGRLEAGSRVVGSGVAWSVGWVGGRGVGSGWGVRAPGPPPRSPRSSVE